MEHYTQILKKHTGKRILIVSHVGRFRDLRGKLFDLQADMRSNEMRDKYHIAPAQIVKLPLVPLANELDKRILSELHAILLQLDQELQTYLLEQATKTLAGFIDKLTNRYLRRSRRRFWDEQMTDDKEQAYMTLFEVIRTYLLVCAPFIPFTTEDLRQQLMTYSHEQLLHPSLHLQPRPLAAHPYVDSQLMEEIATVRKIIKGALYLRAKHQVKVKQPLQTLEFRI